MMASAATRRLLFVSAGLSRHGGGTAAAGRLLLSSTQAWAAERGVAVRAFSLDGEDELPVAMAVERFAGNRQRLARAVWRAQLLDGFQHQLYDFLGVARIQGMIPARLRSRYLVYLHGIECWKPLRGTRLRALAGAAVRLANSAYTVRRAGAQNAAAAVAHPVPLALGEQPGAGAPDDALLREVGEGYVLIVGRLDGVERYKGHDDLLGAMARLATAWPKSRLVIAGDGDDRPRLEALARELGLEARVRFTGFLDDATLAALYDRCALFAMPSRDEGFGLVYLEAMRAGKPCVALADSAAAEIVVDGHTGRLVASGIAPLAAALSELLADPERAADLGANGRARWRQRFRPERFAVELGSHLDALLR